MIKNNMYMLKTHLSADYVSHVNHANGASRASRAVWPAEIHRRPLIAQAQGEQSRRSRQLRLSMHETHKMLVAPLRIHFFYTYMFFALWTGTMTTWMFFLHQWLLLALIVIVYSALMVLLLRSFVAHGYGQERKQDEVAQKESHAFLPAVAPITPMPPSIGKTATLQAYYAQHPQRQAPRTPLPETPLIRVLETVNLKEE